MLNFVFDIFPLGGIFKSVFFSGYDGPSFCEFCIDFEPFFESWFGIGFDGIDGTFRFADAAVYAFVWMYDEDIFAFIEAVDRTDFNTVCMFTFYAIFGDDVSHNSILLMCVVKGSRDFPSFPGVEELFKFLHPSVGRKPFVGHAVVMCGSVDGSEYADDFGHIRVLHIGEQVGDGGRGTLFVVNEEVISFCFFVEGYDFERGSIELDGFIFFFSEDERFSVDKFDGVFITDVGIFCEVEGTVVVDVAILVDFDEGGASVFCGSFEDIA